MKRFLTTLLIVLLSSAPIFAQATQGPALPNAVPVVSPVERADAATNVQHSHSTGATITLTAGAAGSNTQSIYITGIDISNCEGSSAVTPAAPTYITTTGLNGSPQYQVSSGASSAAGTCSVASFVAFTAPLKNSSPGTSVTFVLPSFVTNQTISMNVYYRLGY